MSLSKYIKKAGCLLNNNSCYFKNIFNEYSKSDSDKSCDSNKSKDYFVKFINLIITLQKKDINIKIVKKKIKLFIKIFKSVKMCDNEQKNLKSMIILLKLIFNNINKHSCGMEESSFDKCSDSNSSCSSSSNSSIDCSNDPLYLLKKNKNCLKEVTKKIKNIAYILKMLNIIFVELQRDYIQKINSYNLYDLNIPSSTTDIEYHNKLIQTIYNQTTSLLENAGSGIFNQESDTQPINVFLNNGSIFTLCIIDNIRIRLDIIDCVKTLIIDIGSSTFSVKFLVDGSTNEVTTIVMKDNFNQVKQFIYALLTNKKSILHWINLLKKNNLFC